MAALTAYCLGCKAHREIKNPEQVRMKNGRSSVRGECVMCGRKVFRMGKMPVAHAAAAVTV